MKWGARKWGKLPPGDGPPPLLLGTLVQKADGRLVVRVVRRGYVFLWCLGYNAA